MRRSPTSLLLALISFGQEASQAKRFCFVGRGDLVDPSAPRFDLYPAKLYPPFLPAKLNLRSNPIAKMYRTVIREQMQEGPNFAGQYRVAVWGCGTSCAQFAVVNLKTGGVITADGIHNISGVDFAANDFLPNTDSRDVAFRFNKNSRLLVVIGALNEDDSKEGAFYYLLKGQQLHLVHKTIAARNTCQEQRD
jgi:hypothetical protein